MDSDLSNLPMSINQYQVLMVLGKGGQSEVFLIEMQKEFFAAKVFKCPKAYKQEISTISKLQSTNIIKVIEEIPEAEVTYKEGIVKLRPVAILQLASGGDLYDMMKDTKKMGKIPAAICRAKFLEMIESIEQTHKKGFAHRDIKCQNFVFDSQFTLKLTDFGMATSLQGMNGDGALYQKVGTQIYWAPQIRKGKYQGQSSDIFSLGITLFVLIFGSVPFRSSAFNDQFYQFFKDGDITKNNKYWDKITKGKNNINADLKKLFLEIFNSQPEKRPTLSELRECDWLKKGNIATKEECMVHLSKRFSLMVENSAQKKELFDFLQGKKLKK